MCQPSCNASLNSYVANVTSACSTESDRASLFLGGSVNIASSYGLVPVRTMGNIFQFHFTLDCTKNRYTGAFSSTTVSDGTTAKDNTSTSRQESRAAQTSTSPAQICAQSNSTKFLTTSILVARTTSSITTISSVRVRIRKKNSNKATRLFYRVRARLPALQVVLQALRHQHPLPS